MKPGYRLVASGLIVFAMMAWWPRVLGSIDDLGVRFMLIAIGIAVVGGALGLLRIGDTKL